MKYINFIKFFSTLFLFGVAEAQECLKSGILINATRPGVIMSPGFLKGQYPPNQQCLWYITAPTGKMLRFNFTVFELEDHPSCLFDKVQIFEDKENSDEYVEPLKLCTSAIPPIMTFPKNQKVEITFESSGEREFRGFRLDYTVIDNFVRCPNGNLVCRNGNCFSKEKKCDQVDDCLDGTDEEECANHVSPSTCGLTPIIPDLGHGDRLIGGRDALPFSWPWTVSIQKTHVFPSGHFCGGSLISNNWVITAAHCISFLEMEDYRIVLGKFNQYSIEKEQITRYPQQVIRHPKFNPDTFSNDMALIKLNAPVTSSSVVQSVCLPKSLTDHATEGQTSYVLGWGQTKGYGGASWPGKLHQLATSVMKQETCRNWTTHMDVPNNTLCTGTMGGGYGACGGDNGGPLVIKRNESWFIHGIYSFGPFQCATPETADFYTRVATFVNWISETIRLY